MAAKAKNSSSRTRTKGVALAESELKTRTAGRAVTGRARQRPASPGAARLGSGRLQLPGPKRAWHLGGSVEGHQLPRLRSGEECAGQRVVERVAGLERGVGPDQRMAKQIQVAD